MEWFFFLFMLAGWFFSLFLIREKYTIARLVMFAGASLLLGLMLSTGISFPNGTSSTTVGSTTTQSIQYVVYTAQLSGANSFPVLFGLSWLLIVLGILALIYAFIEIYRMVFAPNDRVIKWI